MHAAVRTPLTAGIALCGATAIALTPIAPTMPALTELQARAVSSAEVALTAAANPIEQWAQVIQAAFVNGSALAQDWLANPAPILRQLLINQLGYGEQIVTALQDSITRLLTQLSFDNPYGAPASIRRGIEQLIAGDFAGGVQSLFDGGLSLILSPALALIGLTQIPVTMAQNFANVVSTLSNGVIGVGFGALSTVFGTVSAFGAAGQAVVDALRAGDVLGAVSALVAVPGAVVGAVLNGYEPTGAFGLLTPNGLIDQLMKLANAVAQAIAPPAPLAATTDTTLAKVSSVPDSVALSATTDTVTAVTVSTTVTEETVTEETVTNETVTNETVTEEAVTEETTTEEPSAATEPETETETTETGAGSTGEATTDNGGTDLSDGNKAEPGSAGETGASDGGGTGGDEADAGTTPSGTTDAEGTGSGDSSAGSGDGDSSGDSE